MQYIDKVMTLKAWSKKLESLTPLNHVLTCWLNHTSGKLNLARVCKMLAFDVYITTD